MNSKTFVVPNMSCGGCTNTIEFTVRRIEGVREVTTNLLTKEVSVTWQEPATWDQIQTGLQRVNYPPETILAAG